MQHVAARARHLPQESVETKTKRSEYWTCNCQVARNITPNATDAMCLVKVHINSFLKTCVYNVNSSMLCLQLAGGQKCFNAALSTHNITLT